MPYIDPTTQKEVPLTGTFQEQNLAASKAGDTYAPTTTTIPGLGDLTVEKKNTIQNTQPTAPTAPTMTPDAGLYARTGIDPYKATQDAYTAYQTAQTADQAKYAELSALTPEQQALQEKITGIDIGGRQAQANLLGQGRGITTGLLRGQSEKIARQTALDRLAASESLAALTGVQQSKLDVLKQKMGFATDNFEKLLGIQKEFANINKTQKDEARQTLTDILDFSKGISFDQLDTASQQQIVNATANSPLSLGIVKTAMERNKMAVEDAKRKEALAGRPASVQEYEYAKQQGYTGSFSQYQNEDANRKAVIAKAGQSGLPNTTITQIDKLSSAFDSSPIVKQYNETQNKYQTISQIVDSGVIGGPDDLALVFEFMKSLDPTSVVRESEYDTASKSGNPFKALAAKMGGYVSKGQILPQDVRDDFKRLSGTKLKVVSSQYKNLKNETARKINNKTGMGDGSGYLTSYEQAFTAPDTPPTPPAFISDEEASKSTPASAVTGIDIQENPTGFFDGFLNMFGLKQK